MKSNNVQALLCKYSPPPQPPGLTPISIKTTLKRAGLQTLKYTTVHSKWFR